MPLSPTDIALARTQYVPSSSDNNLKKLAKKFGCAPSTLHRHLHGGNKGTKREKLTWEKIAAARAQYKRYSGGKTPSLKELAAACKVHESTMSRALNGETWKIKKKKRKK